MSDAYKKGFIDGLRAYAIWRDGSHVPRRLCRTWKEGDGTVNFHLLHHTIVRDADRCKKRGVYYRWLSDRERSFRAIIGE